MKVCREEGRKEGQCSSSKKRERERGGEKER